MFNQVYGVFETRTCGAQGRVSGTKGCWAAC